MAHKTDRIRQPKDIYMDFIQKWVTDNPGTSIVKSRERKAVPHELVDADGQVLLTFNRWSNIVNIFIFEARDRIIQGDALLMPYLGVIHGKRIERNFRNKCINWGETKKQPKVYNEQLGKETYVRKIYYNEEEYCRIGWTRTNAKTMQGTAMRRFKFVPTGSNAVKKRGFKTAFSMAQTNNPALKLRYIFYPYKPIHGT